MSRAISRVAFGRAASRAAARICSMVVASSSHFATVAAISAGLRVKAPKPDSTTKSTLPASWPGRWLDSSVGRPRVAASAIVPGPAFVTMQSEAAIHSSMLFTKPSAVTLTFAGHGCASNSAFASAFLPQTTTMADSWLLWPSSSPTARATLAMPPTPSPPPTTRAVGRSAMSSARRTSGLGLDSGLQKPSRSGSPRLSTLLSSRPQRSAMASSRVEGTNV
mmetsp:Transcript_5734/g.16932  ORF Transcript_5734/g.16932 Transcript_5734/m.16932 type:complete len:221 (-) Transcript_5734:719-1381(-)